MIQFPLTREEFAAKARQLEEQQGIVLTGDSGTLSKMGVTARYEYADGLLSIKVLEKPFFVTTEYCEELLIRYISA